MNSSLQNKLLLLLLTNFDLKPYKFRVKASSKEIKIIEFNPYLPREVRIKSASEAILVGGYNGDDADLADLFMTKEEAIAYLKEQGLLLLKTAGNQYWELVWLAFAEYGVVMPAEYEAMFGGRAND